MNESATIARSGPFWEFLAGRLPAPPAAAMLGWQLSWVAPERGEDPHAAGHTDRASVRSICLH